MSRSIIQTSNPTVEIVQPADLTTYLHGYAGTEDDFLSTLIASARNYVEDMTGYCLAERDFVQYADRFPMFPFAPSALGPLYGVVTPFVGGPVTSFPAGFEAKRNPFEITLWRYPVLEVSKIVYNDMNGNPVELEPGTDFIADCTSEPARVCPMGNKFWPQLYMVGPKAVAIYLTAGYDSDPNALTTEDPPRAVGYPPILKLLVMQLAAHWYLNRDLSQVPATINQLLLSNRVVDYNPSIE